MSVERLQRAEATNETGRTMGPDHQVTWPNAMNSSGKNLFVSQVVTGRDATEVADALVTTWRDIETALAPIIGSKGVAALYQRSLHLASSAHPWLAALRDSNPTSIDLVELKSAVAQQNGALAALGGNALLQTFYRGPLARTPQLRPRCAGRWSGIARAAQLPGVRRDVRVEVHDLEGLESQRPCEPDAAAHRGVLAGLVRRARVAHDEAHCCPVPPPAL
jgi:hypothetical protein